ncbi:MAG TPA: hypothetical protein VJ508_01120, partial [Saprospiraceae bacterium]|nr:hypothetical protein [Saprospiraceae bacterium]
LQADFDRDASSFVFDPLAEIGMESITSSDTKLLMSFGVPPAEFGLWIDLTSPGIRFLESFTFIMSAPLVELEKNAAAKKELWKYMQHYLEASRQA